MGDHLQRILAGIVADPQQRLGALPLLTESERQRLLLDWNATEHPTPEELLVHRCFETQVARTPDAIALLSQQEQLTYHELNRRADLLAEHLRHLGVGPDIPVALCLPRGLDLVIALLAILKAGGAYLLLDPAYPPERLRWMLLDSHAPLLLTLSSHLALFSSLQLPLLCLDLPLASHPATRLPFPSVQPEHLAYVIYTSGSTGLPKGTLLTHRGLLNLLSWHRRAFALSPLDRSSHLAGLSFDAATWELWPPLLCGACLCLLDEHTRLSPPLLQRWLANQAITLCFLPTPLAEQVLALDWSQPTALRSMLVGGDLLHSVAAPSLPFVLVNNYGPTENTVVATSGTVSTSSDALLPSIGRPISNTQCYVLDPHGQPVPIGVSGELYLGGAGLARGYLGQPGLTAERFVPHPWSSEPGARLYRTGDLVRHLPDGSLTFVGRVDSQVKLRGYRIELGEIEATLRLHPQVREAAVTVQHAPGGDQRLVAYLVAEQPSPAQEELRAFLARHLPDYMLPSLVVQLSHLPLSPNGKLDRQALPAPDWSSLALSAGSTPARSPLEEVLVAIWQEVLGLPQVGIHDNFFLLGGHSLLATQVASRLHEVFHAEVPLRTFFEAPTISDLAQRLDGALFGNPQSSRLPLQPQVRPAILPLSFAQQRLWFLDLLEPNSPFYTIAASLHITGSLHVAALEQSLSEIVRRHEVLRTTFTMHGDHAVQTNNPSRTFPLPTIDLSLLTQQQEALTEDLSRAEAQRPFNLAQGPLMRACLLRLSASEYRLLLTLHHIVCDGWSLGILLRELSTLYQAFSTAQPSPLPALPLQYADYTLWQHQWLHSDSLLSQQAYWLQHLSNAPSVLQLPTDHPRPPLQSFQGAHHRFSLPLALCEDLKALSQREGTTLFMTLLAAFSVLLLRYSGQEDILIGTPIANRQHSQLEALIGCFANTLVLRVDLSGSPTFLQLLARIRETALDAYAHQDFPFEQLVETLAPQRSLSHSPLFQVVFALQNAPATELNLTGLTLKPVEVIDVGTARLDLILNMSETPQGLKGRFEYNTELFEAATIERMANHLQQLLHSAVADPTRHLTNLPFLTEVERIQLLVDWNATEQPYMYDVCIHELFEAQALRAPDAIAVVYEEEQLTYYELNQRANHLAHYLQRRNVGPEVPVGVCLPRSLDLIVSILAILKAGGAYVPLDPAYPSERLSFMLRNCRSPLLLTRQSLPTVLTDQHTSSLYLDSEAQAIASTPDNNLSSQVCSQNPAYVIYTSGSTGQPKGVIVSHQAIANRLLWGQMACQLTPLDRMLHLASLSFDIAIWEIFGPWLVGARLVLAQPMGYLDNDYLISLLREQQITIAHFIPAVLHLLVEQEKLADCRNLRLVLYGGEASSPELPRRLLARLDTHIQQFYGPTEAAINATCWQCENKESADQASLGKPIANMHVYVLDPSGQPVPIGITGELFLGGVGLARGYLGQPGLTAERFVPHPWSSEPGARLYRTGDLVRSLPDGSLTFVGRVDNQVKLRGYRIELGEIEATLCLHPSVHGAVVLLREDIPGETRLVAYVMTNRQASHLSTSDLRRFLQEQLPDYMIPSVFMLQEDFPLNANGKIERRLLLAPENLHPELETSYLAPQTATERIIAPIWQEILHVQRVGTQDNFFDLGGHSLLIVRVQSKLQEAFHRDISIVDLFKYPTIGSLATYLNQEQGDLSSSQQSYDRVEELKEGKNRLQQLRHRARQRTKSSKEL